MSRRADILVPAVATAACLGAPPLILTGTHGPLRVVATLLVMALAPGSALLGPRSALALGLVVGASLAVWVVAAEAMLALGAWAPEAATVAVALMSLPALVIRLCRGVGNGRPVLSEAQHGLTDR